MTENLIKNGLLDEEIEEIRNAFKKYDINKTGKIDVKRFLKEMISIGLEIRAPIIYKIFKDLDNEETEKKGGISLDEILNIMNNKLGDLKSEDRMKNVFELLKGNSEEKYLSLDKMKELANSFGMDVTNEEIKDMLERASNNGEGLTFEEFCKIMKENE
jgi:Ca2+-binding EF-hand superfamily protein